MGDVADVKGDVGASRARVEMVDACGRVSQALGFPRSTGQIFGLLYFATRPMCLEEIAKQLQISKASSSTGTRELCGLNAIRQVWMQGERKAYFEAETNLAEVSKAVFSGFVLPRVNAAKKRLETVSVALEEDRASGRLSAEEAREVAGRLKKAIAAQKAAHSAMAAVGKLWI